MNQPKNCIKNFILILGCVIAPLSVKGQITIGSGIEPVKGALLDLKEEPTDNGDRNATKGLLLPRVTLTNLTPGSATGNNSLPVSIGGTEAESWDLVIHTGLMVYNINSEDGYASTLIDKGVYVWTGTQWEFMGGGGLPQGVQYHPAKMGVYEAFYSAEFGTAGRWMTTNLTAWKYDTNITGITLPIPPDANRDDNNPKWCYPASAGKDGKDATEVYNANKQLGLLYNWVAATANQTPGTTPIQGICPNGWHLPSDDEWNALEEEIYNSPQKYSTYTDNSSFTALQNGWETALNLFRPLSGLEAHGKAMKSPNKVTATAGDPDGAGKHVRQGGFNVLLVGSSSGAANGTTLNLGVAAYFWTSSSSGSNILCRTLSASNAGVLRSNVSTGHYSVRCKKD